MFGFDNADSSSGGESSSVFVSLFDHTQCNWSYLVPTTLEIAQQVMNKRTYIYLRDGASGALSYFASRISDDTVNLESLARYCQLLSADHRRRVIGNRLISHNSD